MSTDLMEAPLAFLEWTTNLSVGVPSIDDQHKKLIDIINEFHDGVINAKEQKEPIESLQRTLRKTLNDLIDYAGTHFTYEEDLMESTHYPEKDKHHEEHRELVKHVSDLFEKINWSNPADMSLDIMNFLKTWLVQHIMEEDKAYSKHLISKGIT